MTTPSSTDDALAVLDAMAGARRRPIDRHAMAHDASHYLLVPDIVLTPSSIEDVSRIFEVVRREGRALTFRSGGTSLSGQGISDSVLVDTRMHFRRVTVLEAGHKVRVEPGATVRITNAHLARRGRRLGPDPASEIACTIGGVVANNSSGMACGTAQNTYSTLESMVVVLLSGTVIDTGQPDADDQLRRLEPELYAGLQGLRNRLLERPESVAEIRRQYSKKNTMGYGLNSFLDFELPVEILAHLVIGSEGTLAFVGEVTFATVELLSQASTGLLIFGNLYDAMSALPSLVDAGLATIELMDARSLRVAQLHGECPADVATVEIVDHAAFLVEFQAGTADELEEKVRRALPLMNSLPLARPLELTMTSPPDPRCGTSGRGCIRQSPVSGRAGLQPFSRTSSYPSPNCWTPAARSPCCWRSTAMRAV